MLNLARERRTRFVKLRMSIFCFTLAFFKFNGDSLQHGMEYTTILHVCALRDKVL